MQEVIKRSTPAPALVQPEAARPVTPAAEEVPLSSDQGIPEQSNSQPALPKNPEPFWKATLKGTVEAGATFIKAAVTPTETPVEEIKVRIFDKEPRDFNIPDAVREARQREITKQLRKTEEKVSTPSRTRTAPPIGVKVRAKEANRQQQLTVIRSQLAKVA